jgi:hypothetical protein
MGLLEAGSGGEDEHALAAEAIENLPGVFDHVGSLRAVVPEFVA